MTRIRHKFIDFPIDPKAELLIIGTFNPDSPNNEAEFFYGRIHNHLWRLLPIAYYLPCMRGSSTEEKIEFCNKNKIGFIDLISEVNVEEGNEDNYSDIYIDSRVTEWNDVIGKMKELKNLKKVCFTRKTFSKIPNIKQKIKAIEETCKQRKIKFSVLISPARYYNDRKQQEWNDFLSNK